LEIRKEMNEVDIAERSCRFDDWLLAGRNPQVSEVENH
jgi:hypothetical protein